MTGTEAPDGAVDYTGATRSLQPGDRVRVEVEGVVTHVGADDFYLDHGRGGEPWPMPMPMPSAERRRSLDAWYLHDQPGTRVYRLPKRLPPEVIPGRDVLGESSGAVWRHVECPSTAEDCPAGCPGHWWACAGQVGRYTWAEVLDREGSVRLLGDPIEAPR